MSRYEEEHAVLRIPTAAWAGLKRALREFRNTEQAARYADALRCYARLVAPAGRPQSGEWWSALETVARTLRIPETRWTAIQRSLFGTPPVNQRPLRPKKRDFPMATTKTHRFSDAFCVVVLNETDRTAVWHVD